MIANAISASMTAWTRNRRTLCLRPRTESATLRRAA